MAITITGFLVYMLLPHGGIWGLVAILVFLIGHYFLFKRKDEKTAFELMGIAWLFVLLNIGVGIRQTYYNRTMLNDPFLQIDQSLVLLSNLAIPLLLTLPFVWRLGQRESRLWLHRSRLVLLGILIALMDLLLQVLIVGPMLTWDFYLPEDPPETAPSNYSEEKTLYVPEEIKAPDLSEEVPPE